jgi:hypothetical protein
MKKGSKMSEEFESEIVSRRKALSLLGFAVALGVSAPAAVLISAEAEAQTTGMERRHERRTGRHERRHERRTGRHERRHERRTGDKTPETAPAANAPAQTAPTGAAPAQTAPAQ